MHTRVCSLKHPEQIRGVQAVSGTVLSLTEPQYDSRLTFGAKAATTFAFSSAFELGRDPKPSRKRERRPALRVECGSVDLGIAYRRTAQPDCETT
jgi:hypothetical protein